MTDISFYNLVKFFLSGTTYNSVPFLNYIEDCYADEIEFSKNIQYPAAFLTPTNVSIVSQNTIEYSVKITIAIGERDRFNREQTFSNAILFVNSFLQNLPSEVNGIQYPIDITKGLMFDDAVDGIAFEIKILNMIDCGTEDTIVYPTLPLPNGFKDGQILTWNNYTNSYQLSENITYNDSYQGFPEANLSLNSTVAGGQCVRIENATDRYGIAVYNTLSTQSIGIQSLSQGSGINTGIVCGAKNGTTNIALKVSNTYPDAGENNYAIYSDSTAKSYFKDSIGLGTTNPANKLHISGGTIQIQNGSQGDGYVLTSDANGVGTWREVEDTSEDLRWKGEWKDGTNYKPNDIVKILLLDILSYGLFICILEVPYAGDSYLPTPLGNEWFEVMLIGGNQV